MDANYSFWADLLNKFHDSTNLVQALWLLAVPALFIGMAFMLKEIAVAAFGRKQTPQGKLLYSVHRDADNRLLVFKHAELPELANSESVLLLPSTTSAAKDI